MKQAIIILLLLLVLSGEAYSYNFDGGFMENVSNAISKFATAIQQFEGWFPGSRSYRNNNPGNIKANQNTINWPGVTGQDQEGFLIFDSFQSGWQMLTALITSAFNNTSRIYNSSMTLYDFFSRYSTTDSVRYAQFVAAKLGVDPAMTLNDISITVV